jgi:hypothetical protein
MVERIIIPFAVVVISLDLRSVGIWENIKEWIGIAKC